MQLKTSTGTPLNLSSAKEIAAGGEGSIKEFPGDGKKVIKVYHAARKKEFAKHLDSLAGLSDTFVKPIDVYYNGKGEVVGFSMKYINLNDFFLFNNLFNKGFCSSNGIKKDFKIKLLEKLKEANEELHNKSINFGDENPYNILFNMKGDLLIVDVDSFQTPTQPHSMVLLQDIQDFTRTSISNETDIWAYDILSFWATTHVHPFKWVAPGNTETLEQRVRQGKSILNKIPNIKIPALYEAPDPKVEGQFKEIFGGRRYFVDFGGMVSPVSLVVNINISSTALTIRELFQNVTDVMAANNFIAVKIYDNWSMEETKTPRVTRTTLSAIKADYVFPEDNGKHLVARGAYLVQDIGNFAGVSFIRPEFFYYNGSLTVIDYGTDLQYNFNLNNQLGGGIDRTQTPVFAKSIIIRGVPIQNFGGKKYINAPFLNRYQLFEIPFGTKDALYHGEYIGVEYTEKKTIKYRLFHAGNKQGMDLDYLPFFTTKGSTIFIPEDGFISVVKDFTQIAKLDASMCSRSSKLYSTNAGILLLENNILYLLNTK